MNNFLRFVLALLLTHLTAVSAQTPADRRLVIGSSMPLTGAFSESAKRLVSGSKLYFDGINRAGGINGQQIDYQVLDDAFEPERAAKNVSELISERGAVALIGLTGTNQILASLPVVKKTATPLFGPFSGSPVLRKEKNTPVFHVRASYSDEIQRMIDHAKAIGVRRIGIFYTDDGLGKVVLAELKIILEKENLELVGISTTSTLDANFLHAAMDLWRNNPEAIIVGAAGSHFGKFVTAYKSLGGRWPQIYGLSVVDPGTLGAQISESARGIILTQVIPSVRNTALPIVREYLAALAKEMPGAEPNVFELDAFTTAKILVEAMRRAGKPVSRASLINSLESIGKYDVGGFFVFLTPDIRGGSAFVDLAIIGDKGRLRY